MSGTWTFVAERAGRLLLGRHLMKKKGGWHLVVLEDGTECNLRSGQCFANAEAWLDDVLDHMAIWAAMISERLVDGMKQSVSRGQLNEVMRGVDFSRREWKHCLYLFLLMFSEFKAQTGPVNWAEIASLADPED